MRSSSMFGIFVGLFVAVVFYSLTSPLAVMPKWGLPTHIFVRMLVCELCIILIIRRLPAWRDLRKPNELLTILLCAASSPLFVIAANKGTANSAILLVSTASMWSALMNKVMFGEPATPGFWLRQAISAVGLTVLGLNTFVILGPEALFFGLVNAIVYGAFQVLHGRRPENAPATDMVAGFGIDVVVFGFFALRSPDLLQGISDLKSWLFVVLAGALVGLAYWIIGRSLKLLPGQYTPTIGIFGSLEAPLGLFWSYLFLNQGSSPVEKQGCALIVLAVMWEAWAALKHEQAKSMA